MASGFPSYLHPMWICLMLGLLCAASPALAPFPLPPTPIKFYVDPGLYPDVPGKAVTIKDPARGIVRDVSYRVGTNGLAIIDGDVVFGTEQQLLNSIVRKKKRDEVELEATSSQVGSRSFSNDVAVPGGVVPFFFNSVADQTALLAIVNGAIARWTNLTPYLVFKNLGVYSPNMFGINITSNDVGCYTSDNVLNKFFGQWHMNLNKTFCGVDQATHEFGHALGLIHEHKRPDRNSKVAFQCVNLNPQCTNMALGTNCCNNIVPGCCSKLYDFQIADPATPDDYRGPYDLKSIMQYVGAAFALPGTTTLSVVSSNDFLSDYVNPTTPSAGDAERICKIYKDKCPKAISCANQGCANRCSNPLTTCYSSHACQFDNPPPCCDGDAVLECKAKNVRCNGCLFLW